MNEDEGHSRQPYRLWSEKEVAFLKKNYPRRGSRFVARWLRRSKGSVRRKAELLKLDRQRYRIWNSYEIGYLKQWYAKRRPEEIARRIKHSRGGVSRMASILRSMIGSGKRSSRSVIRASAVIEAMLR